MSTILVSGLANLQITLSVAGFHIRHTSVRYPPHGVDGFVSGVEYNVARALRGLGETVRLVSMIGRDPAGTLVSESLRTEVS